MIQRLGGSHSCHLFFRGVAEGAAGGGEDQLADIRPRARAQALVSAVVFAVNRDQLRAVAADGIHHQPAAGDQSLFVGQTHALAGAHGFIGGFEPGDADDGGDDDAGFACGGHADVGIPAGQQFRACRTALFQLRPQALQSSRIGHHGHFGLKLGDLRGQFGGVPAGHQRKDAKMAAVAPDHVQGAPPDASRRTEERHSLHNRASVIIPPGLSFCFDDFAAPPESETMRAGR